MPFVRSSDGARINYGVSGPSSGPPVVLIQGLGADKTLWALQRLALRGRYRTVAPDNRGVGQSDKPEGPYTLRQMAADVIAVMDHAGFEDAHIIGASMGGIIAQIIALEYPDRVRSLLLACTACEHHSWRIELLEEWADSARHKGMRTMTSEAARWMIGPRSFRRFSPAIGWLGPLAFWSPARGFVAQIDAILNMDDTVQERLHTIDVPVLVMVGNQDILTPRSDSEHLAELIPTAELAVVSGAAHGFMIEHGRTFNRLMLDFLGRAELAAQGELEAEIIELGAS